MSPYCSAHDEWLIMKLCTYVEYHDANTVSTFGGDPANQFNLKTKTFNSNIYAVVAVFVQVASPPNGWSPLSSFLVTWSSSGDVQGPWVIFEAIDVSCPGTFNFSHTTDYI